MIFDYIIYHFNQLSKFDNIDITWDDTEYVNIRYGKEGNDLISIILGNHVFKRGGKAAIILDATKNRPCLYMYRGNSGASQLVGV